MDYTKQTTVELKQAINDATAAKSSATKTISAINAELLKRTGDNKGLGTRNYDLDGVPVKVNVAKDVKWDQDLLKAQYNAIKSNDDDPDQYIKVTYTVEETKYKAWPDYLKEQFNPARTEKEKAATVKVG